MPRIARKKSGSNIYHVMIRGINRQNIFEEDDDRLCFMKILSHCKEISGFRLYAFVLMSNHIHLLIEPAGEPLNTVLTRIETRYAMWYNRKYLRTGYLFQNRYRSEAVETDQYFKTVLRYILQNPMKAGMESRPGTYRWSSYLAYEKGIGAITDTQYTLDLFGNRETLMAFLGLDNDDEVMDEADFDRRLRDEQVREIMYRISQCESAAAFQALDPQIRKEYAVKMYQSGVSLSQTARFTGMPKTTVYRAVQALKAEEAESEKEEAVFRESYPADHFLNDGIVW
jgi:REP element-mobilizing transposase RayT